MVTADTQTSSLEDQIERISHTGQKYREGKEKDSKCKPEALT